ncbi:MAG: hypothetical protein ACI8W8_004482, partial [Rhodothermales bacterium]
GLFVCMTKGLFLCLAPGNNTGKKTPKKSVFMGKAPRSPEEAGQENARWPQRALRKVRFKWPRRAKIKPPPPRPRGAARKRSLWA